MSNSPLALQTISQTTVISCHEELK